MSALGGRKPCYAVQYGTCDSRQDFLGGGDVTVSYERRYLSGSRVFPVTIAQHPPLAERLESAERALEVEATGNDSYACDRLYGYHLLLAGGACALFDPRSSPGVMPGTISGAADDICG